MRNLTRRRFVELSSGFALGAVSRTLRASVFSPAISASSDEIRVTDAAYLWQYSLQNDTFRLSDSKRRLIASGRVQPALVVAQAGDAKSRNCILGRPLEPRREGNRITFVYEGVNGKARSSVTWRFDEHGIWTEPVLYSADGDQDIVSLHYFADVTADVPSAALHATYFVVPGISEASTVSPIVRDQVGLEEDFWLGRGASSGGPSQQWGLPVHYFCGFSAGDPNGALRNAYTDHLSSAFSCGLASLPGGDLYLRLAHGRSSLWVDYRGDLWHHLRGPGPLKLGAELLWSVAPDYYQAIAGYYQGLLSAGVIQKAKPSEKKLAAALSPQFCTWGSQVDRSKGNANLDEAYLNEIYSELKASGMQARMFSIDDKWEGKYGNLEHSAERLPHFEQFLDHARSEGHKIGLWAALMRCEEPASLGLTADHMLKRPNGEPYEITNSEGKRQYYILDFTQPVVAEVLKRVARSFVRRYKPDLLKFDFGYEMPAVSVAGPQDKQWSGERLMWKGLDVLIKAMREENPDLVVMYYQLSPLFLDYFDLYSPDDLFENSGEYDLEANRRFFFSSLLGRLGIPTYSSSGYDWTSAASIWFDAAALGTIGSMNDFRGDERGESGTPEIIARYNGLTHAIRSTGDFEVAPVDYQIEAPARGAHPHSWARFEEGELVLLAQRPSNSWQTTSLAHGADDARIVDAVHCDVPVVVASRTRQSIAKSEKLAIVPYGGGSITIRRGAGTKAEVIFHYLGGHQETGPETGIIDDRIRLVVAERNAAGAPLEWIEVNIA